MNNTKLKIKDFQFAQYFLLNEIDLSRDVVNSILEINVEVKSDGLADSTVLRENTIVIQNPSSVTRCLFNILYSSLSPHVINEVHKDKLGLGLLFMCKNYVYADFNPREIIGPPVLIDFAKISTPYFIIKEIIEPVVGKVGFPKVFYIKCRFTDVCRPVIGMNHLSEQYNLPKQAIINSDFPVLLCNASIQNSAAEMSHLTFKCLEMSFGLEKTKRVLSTILTDNDSSLLDNMVLILNVLNGQPDFAIDFMKYLGSCICLNEEDQKTEFFKAALANKLTKIADGKYTPQVEKQWSQWSMLMGLIEKQLTPMRGSMWPTSKTIKPYEDQLRITQKELAKTKGKKELNFEELLETYRDVFNHKCKEPGKVVEVMMKDKRVWK